VFLNVRDLIQAYPEQAYRCPFSSDSKKKAISHLLHPDVDGQDVQVLHMVFLTWKSFYTLIACFSA